MELNKEPLFNMFDLNKRSGIYIITNEHTGMGYIGKSIDLSRRKKDHVRNLLKDNNSKNFQREFNKFDRNLDIYEFRIIEYIKEEFLEVVEKFFIENYEGTKLHNIRHNKFGEFNYKKYSEEDIWIKEIPEYESLLKIYAGWYEDNIYIGEPWKKDSIFEVIAENGKKLLETDFIKENISIITFLFRKNDCFSRFKNYIALNILYNLDKYRDSKVYCSFNSNFSNFNLFRSGLIEDIYIANLKNLGVQKIIYNASKIKSKEDKYLTEIDLFLYETFELIGFKNLLEATLYYIVYLYTQKILIKQKF
ncbi:GIY-YIG nuclease family protein [Clostridium perfringens]